MKIFNRSVKQFKCECIFGFSAIENAQLHTVWPWMLQYQSDHQLIYRRISCVDRHLKKCCLKYALSLWKMKFRISWKLTIKRVYKDGPITDRFTVDIPRVARRCFKSSLKRYPVQLWESYTFSVNQWRLLSIKDCVLYEWKIAGSFILKDCLFFQNERISNLSK